MPQSQDDENNALPPLPADHGFCEGDRVELPVYGNGLVMGNVKFIDLTFGNKRYKGLAVVSDDGTFYELDPRVAKKTSGQKPPTS